MHVHGTLSGTQIPAAGVTSAVLQTKANRGCPKKFMTSSKDTSKARRQQPQASS